MKSRLAGLAVGMLASGHCFAGESGPQLRLELDLVDGSRIIGTPAIESVPLQAPYAKMDIPLAQIAALTMGEDHETASVDLRNGDKVKGVIDLKPIELETVFGKAAISAVHIKRFVVDLAGAPFPTRWLSDGPLPIVAAGQVTASPYDFCVADFNRDGRPDAAVSDPAPDAQCVTTYLLDCGGALVEKARYPVGSSPQQVVPGDFNEDGRVDLLVAVYSGALGNGTMHLLSGNGDGTFKLGAGFSPKVGGKGLNPCYLTAGDLNKDGHLDFAVCMNNDWALNVHWGNGDGTFTPKYALANGQNPGNPVTADMNADGWPDLACGSQYTHFFVHLSDGGGGFKPPDPYYLNTTHRQPGWAGDLDGDGDVDLVVSQYQQHYANTLANAGNGSFVNVGRTDFPGGETPCGITDFDGDRRADLVLVGGTRLLVAPGRGDGTFGTPVVHELGGRIWGAKLTDLDHDGRMDLVCIDADNHRALMRLNRVSR